jgi:hypothetical protein
MRTRRALERLDARLFELLEELRRQHELDRELNKREHELTRQTIQSGMHNAIQGAMQSAMQSVYQVNREILLELRDHRTILERIDHGVQANTEGLMHVLDELRNGRGGPGTAPAG